MTHALVTIVAPLAPSRVREAEVAIDALGNPPESELKAALDRVGGVHFASLHAFASVDGARAHLILEFSADGDETAAVDRVARALADGLQRVFAFAADWRAGDLFGYLLAHRAGVGVGAFDQPGLCFVGTPGMSVERIKAEVEIAAAAREQLAGQPGSMSALERLAEVRRAVAADPALRSMLEAPQPGADFVQPSLGAIALPILAAFAKIFLWPFGVAILLWTIGWTVGHAPYPAIVPLVSRLWQGFAWSTGIAFAVVLLGAALLLFRLRTMEGSDWLDARAPDLSTNAQMFAREGYGAQNHMVSVTQRKPGWVRWLTSRIAFWIIGALAARRYPPGFLSDIGTIHFARWVTVPGTPDVIFLSNYGGSWESYLEDFITRAASGLTGVWSNSIGFPRSRFLFFDGATDGERFKRYARASMVPTRFWYSAYPSTTTARVRTNALIARGLAGALTEDEAIRWLALFGSALRPAATMVNSDVQSIVFGGLSFLRRSECVVGDLPEDVDLARTWLRSVAPKIVYNDGRRLKDNDEAVICLALSPRGMARLGLPATALATFPFAFVEGMMGEARARMLGDAGNSAPEYWRWGQETPDAALLLYGNTESAVAELAAFASEGLTGVHSIPLKTIDNGKREPFNFVDGVSQPVIRGTYKGLRSADPIHLVEPGEFILGYPDNRGNLPPGPTLSALADPESLLPLVPTPTGFDRAVVDCPRDLGRDGSFLVIRELEQDVDGFNDYCAAESDKAQNRLTSPYEVTPEFIAAKLVGRWQDGSSLVRNPYVSASQSTVSAQTHAARFAAAIGGAPPAGEEAANAQSHPTARAASPGGVPAAPPRPRNAHGDNDFLFGEEDPEALRCPYGAHIRRANPRDSLDPGSSEQVGITNRHRILRVGRPYVPAEGGRPGLLFMCLNGDIERQFEFIQQTWLGSAAFHGLSCEKDPIMGDGEKGECGFTIPTRQGPVVLSSMQPFVATRGGGYFFLAGRRLINWLAAERRVPQRVQPS